MISPANAAPVPARPAAASSFRLSWAFLRRDFRAGELSLLLIALLVAVSAVATVGFFVDRLNQALSAQANRLLGGDLVIQADRPVPEDWQEHARRLGLKLAHSVSFPSMASAEKAHPASEQNNAGEATDAADPVAGAGNAGQPASDGAAPASGTRPGGLPGNPGADDTEELPPTQLSSILAISDIYPLRGSLAVSPAFDAANRATQQQAQPDGMEPAAEDIDRAPERGTVYVDQALAQALGLKLGDWLLLGESRFRISRFILMEQSRGTSFINLAPRLMLSLADLPQTRLVRPGSRVSHRVLLAGEADAIRQFRDWVTPRIGGGQRLEALDEGRPEIRDTLVRAHRFLALVSLLASLIAAVAIGLAARRFAERHLDGFAILKAMGMTQRHLTKVLLLEMLWLALIGGLLGVLLGWGAHHLLIGLARLLLDSSLPPPSVWPAIQAMLVALVLILGFAALPVFRLAGVAPLRVLRRDLGAPGLSVWLVLAAGVTSMAVLLFWLIDDHRLAALSLGGFVLAALVFVLLAVLCVRASVWFMPRQARSGITLALRLALAGWSRRRSVSVIQIVALTVGLMAMVLLTIVRNDLLNAWQQAVPPDAPNRFVINIQPDQRERFTQILEADGIHQVVLNPMVRGRLVAVNDRPIGPADFEEGRARRMVDREFNLSYGSTMPGHNRLDQGRWINPDAFEVSGEVGILQTLGLKIGDRLRFDVAGQHVEMTLVGSRRLKWDSMQVNFFMIASPAALADQPQSLITSFRLPAGKEHVVRRLLAEMPNLTVVDTGMMTRQVQSMMAEVASAVQFLFLFTVLAGCIVLHAAMASVRDERAGEVALMRALGASRGQIASAQWLELSLIGLFAGLMAVGGATALGWVLATQAFDFVYTPSGWLMLTAVALSVVFVLLTGGWGIRRLLDTPPLQVLRRAQG
ncbi:MAG: FtsX-like permease family protein [Lautropia sp.]|nr:FtsX-like permease family protein [Lautropia sp.]